MALVTGCGRIAFDPRADGSPDSPDGTPPRGPNSFAALCNAMRLTIIQDGNNVDDPQSMAAATTIAQSCGTSPIVTTVSQNDPGVLDPTTQEPLLPSTELGVLGGGSVVQRALQYLRINDEPLLIGGPGGFVNIDVRATGVRIVDLGPITAAHDYAIIQIIANANTGTRYLSLFGPGGEGTIAAGRWFSTTFASMLATDRNRWYVIEWTDADSSSSVTPADSFVVVGSDY